MNLPQAYQANYDKIAADHMTAGAAVGENPWQPFECVVAMTALTTGVVRKFVQAGASVLDVGCGTGDLLEALPDYTATGVDIASDYVDLVNANGHHAILAPAEQLPFADGSFDCVICADVLEHVLDMNQVLREALRVLRRRGYLVVRVPKEDDLSPYLESEYEYVHLRRFDVPTLQLLFARVIRPCSVELMLEVDVRASGTLAKEIVCVVRKGAA